MTRTGSALTSANRAMREGRLEEAVALYAEARKRVPTALSSHIDFNVALLRRSLEDGAENSILLSSSDALPAAEELPDDDVMVIVLATCLRKAVRTARLISRRAGHRIAIAVLLTEPAENSVEDALRALLGSLKSKYALIADENVFPCREWLRYAYGSLKRNGGDIVYANNGLAKQEPRWLNALAPPALLQKIVSDSASAGRQGTVEPSFLLVDTSESDIDRPKFGQVHVVDIQRLQDRNDEAPLFDHEVCVVMPSVNPDAGAQQARLLLDRAGMEVDLVVAVDSLRQGFISTLNQVARRSQAQYVVYLAEDAWPGKDWLRRAHALMQTQGPKLLAFNCGKWHGRIAAFGMVDKRWVYGLYGDQVLYEGYRAHRADNELTAIARGLGVYHYAEDCVLAEYDAKKDFRRSEREAGNFHPADAKLFKERFQSGFDGLVTKEALEPMSDEYLDLRKHYGSRPPLEITTPTENSI